MGFTGKSARALAALTCLGVFGACGGGGGGSDASASFATAATSVAEDGASLDVAVVLHTSLPSLIEPLSVDVVDPGTGTATSGSDYTAFAPQTITFPIGAVDGATQSVTLDPLDDLSVEGANETARLHLQNALGGGLSSPGTLTATITDIHTAQIGFATAASSTASEASAPCAVALELQLAPGVTLGVPVSARVADRHAGSASAGADYSSFAARTVTFPVGSADGAVLTVSVQVIDDANIEGDETVELGLSTPSSGAALGATSVHDLTIADDDLAGQAAFFASEGPGGTGNDLTYDEGLDLGSQTVAAGPNAGTLVRVLNGGGTDMALGSPSLSGVNANDFAVDIESSTAPLAPVMNGLAVADAPAPFVALANDGGPGVALALDSARVAELASLDHVTLHDFPVPDLGSVTLELQRERLPIGASSILRIDGQDVPGGVRTLIGDLQLWRGTIAELPGARAFLAFANGGVQGYLELPFATDKLVHFTSEHRPDGTRAVRLMRQPELEALGVDAPVDFCAGERSVPGRTRNLDLGPSELDLIDHEPAGSSALTIAGCRLAIETDYQLYQKFSSTAALTTYVTELVAAASAQYFTDVQTTFSIAYLGLHTITNDGWNTQDSGGTAGDLLDEFQAAWGQGWASVADLAHFMSGANLGGGVAYVDALCSPSFGFGVSGNLSGNIDWSSWTGQPAGFTWDFVVVAHELGHNFGSRHTHDYCPPLDTCYTNCTGSTSCPRGTLMSYCHTCGGMANIDLYFHPVCANIMRQAVNLSCLGSSALAPGDFVQYRVRFNPLTATGARSAALSFAHDATNATQPFRVQLHGTAH